MLKEKKSLLLVFALAITTLLSLLPFFGVGFTTADDFQYFHTARMSWRQWMDDARIYAEGAGRFYFLITKVFYYIPYLFDNFAYTKAVQYISLIAAYTLFSYLVYRLFHSKNIAYLTYLLLIFDTAITPNNHIPTIAYPFYFSFSLIIFLSAILLYLNYNSKGGYWRIIVSALLFLLCYLFYETYLIFAIIFGIIIVVQQWREKGFLIMLKDISFWRKVIPYIISAIIYIACYFGYRRWLMATMPDRTFYDGAAFSIETFSLQGFFSVLNRCTEGAMPGVSFFKNRSLIAENSLLIAGHRSSPMRILTHASAIVWINALIQTAILWYTTKSIKPEKQKWGHIIWGIIISVVTAYFSHTLIGIASKYNLDWCHWMKGYVTTFFSILALMLALALIIVATLKLCRHKTARKILQTVWCIVFLLFSILIGYTNEHISREWQKSHNRLKTIDLIAKTGFFDTLPANAIIYTEELHKTSWVAYDICKESNDLERYISLRASRRFEYISNKEELYSLSTDRPVYYLHAIETQKGCELLLTLSKIDNLPCADIRSMISNKVDIFYLSPSKRYIVFYQSNGQWKALPYGAESHNTRLTHVSLCDSLITPHTIVVSNMIMPN